MTRCFVPPHAAQLHEGKEYLEVSAPSTRKKPEAELQLGPKDRGLSKGIRLLVDGAAAPRCTVMAPQSLVEATEEHEAWADGAIFEDPDSRSK